jgi:hypothetical protein
MTTGTIIEIVFFLTDLWRPPPSRSIIFGIIDSDVQRQVIFVMVLSILLFYHGYFWLFLQLLQLDILQEDRCFFAGQIK